MDLVEVMNTTIDQVSNIYTVRSAGYTVGALSGFIFNYINRQLSLAVILVIFGASLAVTSLMPSMPLFFFNGAINGVTAGAADTAINVWLMEMWPKNNAPFIQGLHFCFGLSALIAPVISRPFI